MVEFERTCTVPHARIYYELLCDDPQGTLAELCDFLGLSIDDELVTRMFSREHGRGPGDYKITSPVASAPTGRPRLDPSPCSCWHRSPRSTRCAPTSTTPRWKRPGGATCPRAHRVEDAVDRRHGRRTEALGSQVHALLSERTAAMRGAGDRTFTPMDFVVRIRDVDALTIGLDATGSVTSEPSAPSGTHPSTRPRVFTEGDVLVEIAAGTVNLAQAALDGRVRVSVPEAADGPPQPTVRQVMVAIGELLRPSGTG